MVFSTPQTTRHLSSAPSLSGRIIGYDVARALAFMGMVIVNFRLVMVASNADPGWLAWLVGLLEGRAVATFVILAGVGMSLVSRQARLNGDTCLIIDKRQALLKRAGFLFAVGLLFATIWPPDILHFYGVYIAIGAFLLVAPDRWLWIVAFAFMSIFVLLLFLFDYEQGWDWETLTYLDFWTVTGMVRHLFYNGFHPVFPWTAFLLVGMWLGRQQVQKPGVRRRILVGSIGIVVITETISWLLVDLFVESSLALDAATVKVLLDTEMIPPMPQYLFAGGGAAVAVIMLCLMLAEKLPEAKWLEPLVATGQLALTLYVAHIIIGMGILEVLGVLNNQTLSFSLMAALLFCLFSTIFSAIWRRYFSRGPLEWVMRQLA